MTKAILHSLISSISHLKFLSEEIPNAWEIVQILQSKTVNPKFTPPLFEERYQMLLSTEPPGGLAS